MQPYKQAYVIVGIDGRVYLRVLEALHRADGERMAKETFGSPKEVWSIANYPLDTATAVVGMVELKGQ